MQSYLTETEITELNKSFLNRDAPFLILSITKTQFSISRHTGGAIYNGQKYTYIPQTDELIRDDVIAWLIKYRKNQKRQKRAANEAKQETFL